MIQDLNRKVHSVFYFCFVLASAFGNPKSECGSGFQFLVSTLKLIQSFPSLRKFAFIVLLLVLSFWESTAQNSQTFTSNGAFTVPAGVTSVTVECWGGGGGGSSITSTDRRGGGGGGGAYASSNVIVAPGNTYNVIVGTGGAANSSGGASSFNLNSVVAAGGGGAANNDLTSGIGGSIAASIGNTRYAGGNGANGGDTDSGGGGGAAGSSGNGGDATGANPGNGGPGNTGLEGTGGTGVNGSSIGNAGNVPGGGGSGAVTNSATSRTGGTGARGQVKISWTCPTYSITSINSISAVCLDNTATVTVISTEAALPLGGYVVNYTLSGANTGSGNPTMAVTTAGTGTFATLPLANPGTTTITITTLSSGASPQICSTDISPVSQTITVEPLPTASAGGSQTICSNGTATVSGASAANGTIVWTHNGAGSISGANTLTPTYTAAAADAGNTVTLTMTVTSNNACSPQTATATYSVTVDPLPTASAGGSQTICSNGTAIVSGASASNGTIAWTHNGAGSISGANTLTPTYTAAAADAGNTVTLTMTVTSNNTCTPQTATATYSVTVDPRPTASAGGSQTICSNGTSTVSGASATNGTIAWTHNGAGSISGANTLTPTYTAAAADAGNTVTLTMTVSSNNACSPQTASATYSVTIEPLPTASAGGSQTICSNGTATVSGASASNGTIAWTHNGAGSISGATTLTPTYTAASADAGNTVTLTMTVPSNNACSPQTASATYSVTVEPLPTASAGGSQTICSNGTATVSGASATNGTIAWTHNGAGSISGANTLTPTYTAAAADAGNTVTLTMTATSNNSCAPQTAMATYTILINPIPSATIPTGQTFCNGILSALISLTGTPSGVVFDISGGTAIGLPNQTGVTFIPAFTPVAGTATIVVTPRANGCTGPSVNFNITVQAAPTSGAIGPATQTICPNTVPAPLSSTTTGTGSGTISYLWERSTDNGTTWNTVSGTTTASYAPAALSQSTRYRRTTISTQNGVVCQSAPTSETEVIVADNTPPVFTAPANATVYLSAACTANTSPAITGTVAVKSDDCTPAASLIVNYSDAAPSPGVCIGTYSITRTWTVTDASGNTTSLPQVITIQDNIKPTLTLPQPSTIECTTSTDPANTGQATATDNCGGTVTITYSDVTVAGVCAGRSTITRTWTATDCSGNQTTGTQTISRQDTQAPDLVCTNFSVANPSAIPASDAFMNLAAVDNCGGPVEYVLTAEEYTGLTGAAGFCPQTVIRKYVARDQCGNTSFECTQTITVLDRSGCAICQSNVPFYPAILSGAPDSLWISPNHTRQGICCNASGPPPPRCTSFNVYLDKDAVGLIFNIASGAKPPGALFYQVDCGPEIAVGQEICLAGGRFYTVTFCKPGGNSNTYSIQSISGITGSTGLITRQDAKCADTLSVTGVTPSSVTWTVKSPNDQTLLRYLSCTNCTDPIFTPDTQTPPTIVYQVCGTILGAGTCNGNPITDCNDVTVTTLPPIAINFNIDPGNICANNIPSINAAVTPINLNYNYQWFDAPDGTGNLLSTNSIWTPTGEGSYSLVVTETTSGVLCNTSTHNFDINFDVLGPSTLNVPAPLVVECNDPNASQQIINWLASATAFDETESIPVTNDYSGITMACNQPPLTVVFSAADECGNLSTASSTITVVDTRAPTWTTSAGFLDRTVDCSDPVLLNGAQSLEPAATDLCDPTLTLTKTAGNFVQGTCPNSGTYTNTWTATDDCGNVSAVYSQVITITDTQPPVVTGTITATTVEGCVAANAPSAATSVAQLEALPGAITINDACTTDALLTVTHSDASSGTCPVVVTRTYTITDNCNNSTQTIHTINVGDTTPPGFTVCPAPVTVAADAGSCSATNVVLGTATATDNCSATTITNNAPALYSMGTTTVTWTATDACGNTSTCSQTVTVTDTQLPTITCPANVSAIATAPNCFVPAIVVGDPVYSDNCPNPQLTWTKTGATTGTGSGLVNNTTFNVGVTTVTYTVTDASGNVASCQFTVTVNDQVPPTVITCPPNITQSADAAKCETSVTVAAPVVTDPCNEIVSVTNNSPYKTSDANASGIYPVGVTTITWSFTDTSGNISTCTQTVTVTDTQLPTITCPANVSAIATAPNCFVPAIVVGDPVYSDNCPNPQLTWTKTGATTGTGSGLVNNTTFNVGVTTVTYTVTDASGNVASCQFTVTVNDQVPPTVITCPPNITQSADAGKCETSVTVAAPVVTDPCNEIVSVTNNSPYKTSDANASGIYPVGVTTITWSFTDTSGNISTCTQTVTVTDTQLPTITCPANVSAIATAPNCFVPAIVVGDPVYSDNCPNPQLTWTKTGATTGTGSGLVNNTTFNVGVTTVTYTVTDASGNTASCQFTVTVNDQVPPTVITCPPNITQSADAGKCETSVTVAAPVVTDPCNEIVSVTNNSPYKTSDANASGIYPVGVTTITWSFTDTSGNISTCTQTVTVTDTQLPTITCPANVLAIATAPNCFVPAIVVGDPVYADNCPNPQLTWTKTGATTGTGSGMVNNTTFNVGVTTVTYTVTDASGNAASCSFTVTVNDQVPPTVITCPPNITQSADAGKCETSVTVAAPVVTDPCNEIVSVTNNSPYKTSDANASGTYPVGVTTITWSFTDTSGNISTCTQTVTVTDSQLPTITCPANVSAIATAPNCFVPAIVVADPVYADNCPNPVLTWTKTGATTGTGSGLVNNTTFNVGVTTVTYTVTDASGNTASCQFTVTVNDQVPPTVITCPPNITQSADAAKCETSVTVAAPVVTDPCNEIVSVTNNSPYKTSDANASGIYPVGATTITWSFTDTSGNISTCTQTVTVTDFLPTLSCPANINASADFEQPFASNVIVPAPTYGDNCPGIILTWTMTGATTAASPLTGENIVASPGTFNVGVTTITYTLTDANSHVLSCSFTVTIASKPDIDCQPDITRNTDPGLCTAAIDPGMPVKISGAEPITYTWAMTGATIASGTGAIGTYNFNEGTTTITWRAENVSGFDECTQQITVVDNIAPTYTVPPALTDCVELVISASYNAASNEFNKTLPEYYLFEAGSTLLNLTNLADNCCAINDLIVRWRIDFEGGAPTSISGTGQPSAYGANIQFPGDSPPYSNNRIHVITFWVEDCNGNVSGVQTTSITITPRPQIIKN